MDNKEIIEKIKLNEEKIDELRIKQYETLKKIMDLYRIEKENENEQTN